MRPLPLSEIIFLWCKLDHTLNHMHLFGASNLARRWNYGHWIICSKLSEIHASPITKGDVVKIIKLLILYDLITAYLLRKLLIFAVETSPSEMEVYQPWDEGGNLIFVLWMNIHNLCWYIRAAFCLWCSNWLQSVNCVSTKRLKCPLSLLFYFSFAYSISRLHIVRIIRLGCELQRKESRFWKQREEEVTLNGAFWYVFVSFFYTHHWFI